MAKVKNQPVFDPKKNYKWEPSDSFTITGQEFASFYHCLTQAMNTPGGAPAALWAESYGVVMEILKRGVASGIIEEVDNLPQVNKVDDNVRQLFNS